MMTTTQPLSEITDQTNQEQDVLTQVKAIAEELDVFNRVYFNKDRNKVMKAKIDTALALLEQKPLDLIQNKKEKADYLYYKGKCMDFLPEYTKQAEENLSKAIKLMPTKKEAWDALGHVYWKKQDIEHARKCFEGSLEQDEKNVNALRNLSMVLRQITKSPTGEPLDESELKKNFQLSISLANKAIALDMSDSMSWYVLGNAHYTHFFTNNESTAHLDSALKAYAQSEKTMQEPNPDLFYNRATVLEYLERYGEAVANYTKADAIDPSLQAEQKTQQIIGFVSRAYNSIANKGRLKTNRLIDMVKSIPQTISSDQDSLKVVDISMLQNGENPGVMVSTKVVNQLDKQADVPLCFLLVDYKHNFCVASIYHTSKGLANKIKSGCEILIKNPQLVLIQLSFKGYQYNYQCLKVTNISGILVNGQALTDQSAPSVVLAKTFS